MLIAKTLKNMTNHVLFQSAVFFALANTAVSPVFAETLNTSALSSQNQQAIGEIMPSPLDKSTRTWRYTIPLSVAFNESIYNSPRAAKHKTQLGITRAAYAQALTLPNPSLFLLRDTAQLARQAGALIPIESPWKLAFRVLLVKAQLKQTDLEIQKALWQLRGTTRRAYLDVVIAQETKNTLEQLSNLSSDLKSIAKRRFEIGDVADMDVQRAELAALMSRSRFQSK